VAGEGEDEECVRLPDLPHVGHVAERKRKHGGSEA
jgi:hypothetical protein